MIIDCNAIFLVIISKVRPECNNIFLSYRSITSFSRKQGNVV